MTDQPTRIIICSCEDSMLLDADAVRAGCKGRSVATARHLCGTGLDQFRDSRPTAV